MWFGRHVRCAEKLLTTCRDGGFVAVRARKGSKKAANYVSGQRNFGVSRHVSSQKDRLSKPSKID